MNKTYCHCFDCQKGVFNKFKVKRCSTTYGELRDAPGAETCEREFIVRKLRLQIGSPYYFMVRVYE